MLINETVMTKLQKVISREASLRSQCPDLRADMAQNAWLACLEFQERVSVKSYDQSEIVKIFHRNCITPAVSKYFWKNQSVVSCTRPRKGVSCASNVTLGGDHERLADADKFIFHSEEAKKGLERKVLCDKLLTITLTGILPEREASIISERYFREKPTKRKVLAATLSVSQERTRQIETRALDRLREILKEDYEAIYAG